MTKNEALVFLLNHLQSERILDTLHVDDRANFRAMFRTAIADEKSAVRRIIACCAVLMSEYIEKLPQTGPSDQGGVSVELTMLRQDLRQLLGEYNVSVASGTESDRLVAMLREVLRSQEAKIEAPDDYPPLGVFGTEEKRDPEATPEEVVPQVTQPNAVETSDLRRKRIERIRVRALEQIAQILRNAQEICEDAKDLE